ncbi:MAG: hypothetical protein OXS32_14350, partial [Verrucomicrobiales bacterium]|nr:hypothetical protein [Verrucomicrobiales bacterium]
GIYAIYDTLVAKGASEKIWDNSGYTAKELIQEHELEKGLGVDLDGDGFDEHDELLTGHSDDDPDDTPTQDEVDEALAAREKINEDWRSSRRRKFLHGRTFQRLSLHPKKRGGTGIPQPGNQKAL